MIANDTQFWINEDDVEESAHDQLLNLELLPFATHMAVMPDIHTGYGMPIGVVLATEPSVIIPNAVGVDIGCVDCETEFLSPSGWVRIDQWSGQEVMQYNAEFRTAKFVSPLAYVKEPCDSFIHFKTKYGIDQMLSPEHRCLVFEPHGRNEDVCQTVISAQEIWEDHCRLTLGYRGKFETAFEPRLDTKSLLSDKELRVAVMVCADGTIDKSGRARVRFKKGRKITRFVELLEAAGIPFNVHNTKDDSYSASFFPPIAEKGLGQFWHASLAQLRIISDESINWDGNEKDQVFFTRSRAEADFIQYVFSATGHRAVLREDAHYRDGKTDYRVFRYKNTRVGIAGTPKTEMKKVPSTDGFKYCFTVPTSFLVLRRKGNVFITGNCGMCVTKLALGSCEVDYNDLRTIWHGIKERVPVGRSGLPCPHEVGKMPSLKGFTGTEPFIIEERFNAARSQLGTLGGGNHFIEIQRDEDGYLYIMIHSGSRNLGHRVASHYTNIARKTNKQNYSVVDDAWELAFLHQDDINYPRYMLEMEYCIKYAAANRLEMAEQVRIAVDIALGRSVGQLEYHDICHNMAGIENHMGKNHMVHRKGVAGPYRGDRIGIIPGSMGTSSYLVKLKKDAPVTALCSTSHGAGRAMSRKKARAELSLASEQIKMVGIVNGLAGESTLDEAPGAYKDVDKVIDQQSELLDVVTKLTPLVNVKG